MGLTRDAGAETLNRSSGAGDATGFARAAISAVRDRNRLVRIGGQLC